jgi:hypothetical protein
LTNEPCEAVDLVDHDHVDLLRRDLGEELGEPGRSRLPPE